jgi:hypothetical protein
MIIPRRVLAARAKLPVSVASQLATILMASWFAFVVEVIYVVHFPDCLTIVPARLFPSLVCLGRGLRTVLV